MRNTQRLDAAVTQFPFLGRVLGRSAAPLVDRAGGLSFDAAEMLCRTAFLPASLTKAMSAGRKAILKARTFMANFIVQMQIFGIAAMLTVFGKLLWRPDGAATDNIICLGISHGWDESKQMLRERRPSANTFARQSAQRVGKNILVQNSMVHAMGIIRSEGGRAEVYHRSESFLVAPLELAGKTANFLAEAVMRAMAVPVGDVAKLRAISQRVSGLIITMWGDGASTNRRFLKHLCALCEEEGWPSNILLDPSEKCLLHQLHRVKTRQLEGHSLVSLSYCFARLVRSGAVLGKMAGAITEFVESHCERRVQPPPAAAKERAKQVFDILYTLDASHHVVHSAKAKGSGKSALLRDIEFMLAMDGGNMLDRGPMVHYCWQAETGQPCCKDRQECIDKMTAAYLNLFVCHSCPSGSLSRWTHVGAMFALLCSAFVCRDVFVTAALASLPASDNAEDRASGLQAGAIGAGDTDYAVVHAARVQKVKAWLTRPASRMQIGVLFVLVQGLDRIMYFLMGGNTRDGARSRRPGTTPRHEEPLPCRELLEHVSAAMASFLLFLQQWQEAGAPTTVLLQAMGVADSELAAESTWRFARRVCLGFSSGLFRRFVLRLSAYPYRLWVIADGTFPAEVCQAEADGFYQIAPCCAGFFGRRLRRLLPDSAALLSPLGRTCLATWLRTLVWSVYGCEKEHASCRRLLLGSGPSRSWTLCARERLLEMARTIHIERTTVDPAQGLQGALSGRPTPAQQLAAASLGEHAPGRNPLQPVFAQVSGDLPVEISQTHVTTDLSHFVGLAPGGGMQPELPAAQPQAFFWTTALWSASRLVSCSLDLCGFVFGPKSMLGIV